MLGNTVDPNSRRNADALPETSENVSSHEPSLIIAHSDTEVKRFNYKKDAKKTPNMLDFWELLL